jgi:hypothetical protein
MSVPPAPSPPPPHETPHGWWQTRFADPVKSFANTVAHPFSHNVPPPHPHQNQLSSMMPPEQASVVPETRHYHTPQINSKMQASRHHSGPEQHPPQTGSQYNLNGNDDGMMMMCPCGTARCPYPPSTRSQFQSSSADQYPKPIFGM